MCRCRLPSSGSSVSKNTREPSSDAPAKNAKKSPLPPIGPRREERGHVALALVDVGVGPGREADQVRAGVEEDARAGLRGALEGRGERRVGVQRPGRDQRRGAALAHVDVLRVAVGVGRRPAIPACGRTPASRRWWPAGTRRRRCRCRRWARSRSASWCRRRARRCRTRRRCPPPVSGSCVSKNTREPSVGGAVEERVRIGVSARRPGGDHVDRRAGALVDVVGGVRVAGHQYLVGVQPHLRAVGGGARRRTRRSRSRRCRCRRPARSRGASWRRRCARRCPASCRSRRPRRRLRLEEDARQVRGRADERGIARPPPPGDIRVVVPPARL